MFYHQKNYITICIIKLQMDLLTQLRHHSKQNIINITRFKTRKLFYSIINCKVKRKFYFNVTITTNSIIYSNIALVVFYFRSIKNSGVVKGMLAIHFLLFNYLIKILKQLSVYLQMSHCYQCSNC